MRSVIVLFTVSFLFIGSGIVSDSFGQTPPVIVLNPPSGIVIGHALDFRVYFAGEQLEVMVLNQNTGASENVILKDFSGTKGQIEILPTNFSPQEDDPDIEEELEAEVGHTIIVSLVPDQGVTKAIMVSQDGVHYPPGEVQPIVLNLYEDLGCGVDADGDGIPENDIDGDYLCDTWENNGNNVVSITHDVDGDGNDDTYEYDCMKDGSTYGRIPCDETIPDIFVELDWMEGHRPENTAVATVVNAFLASEQNIHVHIQTDTAFSIQHDPDIPFPGLDSQSFPEEKGFDQLKGTSFGTAKEKITYPGQWDQSHPQRILKHQFFHYGLFVHETEDDVGSSGIGETNGNDFMISLGSFTGQVGSLDQQAGTLMHELGHNLGLLHGGGDNLNNKPNYFSVMSYSRQMADLDPNRPLDYSSAVLGHNHNPGSLVESNLLENDPWGIEPYPGHYEGVIYACPWGALGPLYYKAGTVVNWDCDSVIDTKKVRVNINNLPAEPSPTPINEVLVGYDDWSNLHYNFTEYGDYIDGRHLDTQYGKELSIEGVTKNRISHLLSLYGVVFQFEDKDFEEFRVISYEGIDSTPKISFIQLSSNSPIVKLPPIITTPSKILPESNFTKNTFEEDLEYYTGKQIEKDLSTKEKFLKAIELSIEQINHHDLERTKFLISLIDNELDFSLNDDNYAIVSPIMGNLTASYDIALDFNKTNIHRDDHKRVSEPIVHQKEVDSMIEQMVDYFSSSPSETDHETASVSAPQGTSVPGCEETDECFIPYEVTVDVGGVVTWSNDDSAAHTVTAGSADDGPSGVFDSSLFMAGTTFSHTFEAEGEFPYFCMVHPWMEGIVTVQAAGEEDEDEVHMDGEEGLMVDIATGTAGQGERLSIDVTFTMMGESVEHVNYDIKATQNGEVVLDEMGVHDHDGAMNHMTAPLPSAASDDTPIEVEVMFNGFGIDEPFTGPVGEVATTQVVPEFGTVVMMILAVAIISIVAVTAKSRVIPRL